MRNTPQEVAELEPGMTAELQAIVDRYNVIVLGYSGSDEAIASIIKRRSPRYGLWWVSRGDPTPTARSIIGAAGGRVVMRPGAEEFLADLDARVAVLETHPTGHTPASVHDEILARLRQRDGVGCIDASRRERDHYFRQTRELAATGTRASISDVDGARALRDAVMPIVERRLASLIPLVIHDEAAFSREFQQLTSDVSRRQSLGGATALLRVPEWAAWFLGYACGAFALRERRWLAIQTIVDASYVSAFERKESVLSRAGETGTTLGATLQEKSWISPAWQFAIEALSAMPWLAERYPGFVDDDQPKTALVEFAIVASVALALRNEDGLAYWTMYDQISRRFALELHHDATLRVSLAEVLHESPDELLQKAAASLAEVRPMEPGLSPDLARLLMTGRD